MPRHLEGNSLVIASHNIDKIKEISLLLSPYNLTIFKAADFNLPEPDETGTTYIENALIKAQACASATGLPALADDSGIEVAALGNKPGVDTAPYTKEQGGREKVFALWETRLEIKQNNAAAFVCVHVLAWPDGHYEHSQAFVHGRLTFPPRGNCGHGYDPIFVPDGFNKTVAQMTMSEKNTCSHRFLALQKLIDACILR